ncbi:ABC transporter ATP-binding protein [Bhargavaea cecembensis]|uniref:ABC transporter ATP-binding protein n=1 Tax=Bhargavaea cecembensis TaxID=394098 RepID=UPI00058FBFFE|nr:ABC transporter ATP-binding protein [Bhargavaea cecembensis]
MKATLEVSNLTKRFNGQSAVDELSFSLAGHTATALIGPNGSGKTTTMSMIAGLLRPTSGTVRFEGAGADPRSGIGFLPQYPNFFPWMTALEYMEMAAGLSGMSGRETRAECERTLGFVGLSDAARKRIGGFSGGMKQRLGLAQAIVHRPALLLLDEPVSALDPAGRREVMDMLKELGEQATILYSTHILNDAEEMTDQLLFLRKGRLIEQGPLGEIKEKYGGQDFRVEFKDAAAAGRFAAEAPWPADPDGASVRIPADAVRMEELLGFAAGRAAHIRSVGESTVRLEEIFLKVVGRP